MSSDKTTGEVCDEVRELVLSHPRKRYPYLKQAALDDMLDAGIAKFEQGLKQQESEMAATKSRINFFSLSAELRNHIYSYALGLGENIDLGIASDHVSPTVPSYPLAALLSANKQIRVEALPMYWALNTISLSAPEIHGADWVPIFFIGSKFQSRFRRMGQIQAGMVKKVKVQAFDLRGFCHNVGAEVGDAKVKQDLRLAQFGFEAGVIEIE